MLFLFQKYLKSEISAALFKDAGHGSTVNRVQKRVFTQYFRYRRLTCQKEIMRYLFQHESEDDKTERAGKIRKPGTLRPALPDQSGQYGKQQSVQGADKQPNLILRHTSSFQLTNNSILSAGQRSTQKPPDPWIRRLFHVWNQAAAAFIASLVSLT